MNMIDLLIHQDISAYPVNLVNPVYMLKKY
ncbi:MAG: hypothetical protein BMS9Abin36_2098 [Gammaproteobacteria bacterium]|nr:MAG: hypothetical protein BMS9Abin36_2098 [Gammaproteobacteria bacterium]